MLHNTGPFGPNDAPGAPVNMTPTGQMNIVNNINHLAKLGHGNTPTPNGPYGLGDYGLYQPQHFNMPPQMAQYPNHQYQHLGYQSSYPNHGHSAVLEENYQNGMLPMNLNVHSEHNTNIMNYPYDKTPMEMVNKPDYSKDQNFRKMPLNIPQIPNKPYYNNDYVHNDSFHNSNHNLDLSFKPHERLPLDNVRRKKIENTVKLIENILINSTNVSKQTLPESICDIPNEINYNKNLADTKNTMPIQTRNDIPMSTSTASPMPTRNDKPMSTSTAPPMPTRNDTPMSTSTAPPMPTRNDTPMPTRDTMPIPTINATPTSTKNVTPLEIQNSTSIETNEDALSLTTEDSKKVSCPERPSIIRSAIALSDNKSDDSSDSDETPIHESETKDIKPVQITLEIAPEDAQIVRDKCIEIKIEKSSWTDTDYAQPFFRDPNAFQRDEIYDLRIIDSETSVVEATAAVNNGLKSDDCYECPHCSVLFKNPKRFLIHNKWHTFGLTIEKRMELLREREEKRNQRKEAKIIERMNAKDVTDKMVAGKTWPCKDCDKVFSAKGSLKNHRQRSHPTRVRECRVCHKPIVGWIALRNHMATHASDAGSGFQCHQCPKRFKYSHSLAKHSDTHLEKIHGCKECPKKFGSQMLLKMHMKTHEKHLRGATFRCTYCAKGFFESYSLQVHERTHRNERPYLCEICKTSFGTNSSLKRHLKVSHSTSKPFECPVCHRSFSTEAIRDRHHLRLHGKPEDFKFPCKLCHCKYGQLKDLQKHVYKAHPKNKRKKKVKSDSDTSE